MAVPYGGDQLPEILPAELLRESVARDSREQLAALGQLHDEVDLRLGGEDLGEEDDVRVAEAAHDRDFPLDVRRESVFQTLLLDDFDRDAFAAVVEILRLVDFGERAAAEKLSEVVFAEQRRFVIVSVDVEDDRIRSLRLTFFKTVIQIEKTCARCLSS